MATRRRPGATLDLAIQGEGFFAIQLPDGSVAYTRDGQFAVRGRPDDRRPATAATLLSDSGSPIVLSAAGGKVTVNPDGNVMQGATTVGRIGLQKFLQPSSDLMPVGRRDVRADNGAQAQPVDQPDIIQGYLEDSNVTPMREMVDLVLISRSYEANQKVITTADEQMQKVLDALG